jgi:hypothetical protein
MLWSIVILILLMAVAVFFASDRHAICLRRLLMGSALVSLFGLYVLLGAPKDYLTRLTEYPWAEKALHPWVVGGWSGIAIVAFCCLSLGLFARFLVNGCRRRRQGP